MNHDIAQNIIIREQNAIKFQYQRIHKISGGNQCCLISKIIQAYPHSHGSKNDVGKGKKEYKKYESICLHDDVKKNEDADLEISIIAKPG